MWKLNNNSFGIGLRSEHIIDLITSPKNPNIDFLEVVPDNWMNIGGAKKEYLKDISKKYPLVAHSLSLSIGDICPLNKEYIINIRKFLDEYNIKVYSDHLCFSRDSQGYLYELLPLPKFYSVIPYLCQRIDQVQDILGRKLILENISYYYKYENEITESDFWNELLQQSDCDMLLDINNVYINAFNHCFDAKEYIKKLPSDSISYYHIAGHLDFNDFKLDTHGKTVIEEVLKLAKKTVEIHGNRPLLLERDNNIPPLNMLIKELLYIKRYIS